MAGSSYGVNHPLAVKLWARKLFREALKESFMGKYIGSGSNSLITMQNDTKKGPGDRVRVGLRMQLTGTGIAGDDTLEGNEEALTLYYDDVTINQLRHAVRSGGRMSEQRVPFSVREEARMGLTDWWADRIDTWIINQLTGNTAQADVRYTGMQATVAPSSTRIIGANGATTEASVSASTGHGFTLTMIDRAVALAKTTTPLIRPVRANGGSYYMCFIHPFQTYQLRTNTNTGQWADIQKSLMMGGRTGSDNPIFSGALGIYNNTILVENTRMPTFTAGGGVAGDGRRAVFCGAQAAIMGYGQDSGPSEMTWVEELFDFENQLGVAAGMIGGVKKTVFNSVDFGAIVMPSWSPQP